MPIQALRLCKVRIRTQQCNAWLAPVGLDCSDRKSSHHSPLGGVIMKTRRRLALALGLAAVVAVGNYVATGKMPAGAEGPQIKEQGQQAKERREQFIAAFNKGDAKAVAAFWTEDATYVGQDGRAY